MFKKEKKTATLKKFQYLGIIYLFIGIGCMAPKLMPITKEIKEEFKVYNDSELKNLNYKRLGIIESFHCKRWSWDPPANYKNGIAGLAYKSRLLGGHALANLKCDTDCTDLAKNCWESIRCIAASIKFDDGSSQDFQLTKKKQDFICSKLEYFFR